jgi:hypothetical protein
MTAFKLAVIAGVFTGTLATAVEILLWWGFGFGALDMLFRDARFAAAIILGRGVLPPPSIFDWRVMFAATLVHFTLSIAYAGLLDALIRRFSLEASIVLGALFGSFLYVVNMCEFMFVFPWFVATWDWIIATALRRSVRQRQRCTRPLGVDAPNLLVRRVVRHRPVFRTCERCLLGAGGCLVLRRFSRPLLLGHRRRWR